MSNHQDLDNDAYREPRGYDERPDDWEEGQEEDKTEEDAQQQSLGLLVGLLLKQSLESIHSVGESLVLIHSHAGRRSPQSDVKVSGHSFTQLIE